MIRCWACGERSAGQDCGTCRAPRVENRWSRWLCDGPGVYVVSLEDTTEVSDGLRYADLFKIGLATTSISGRVYDLERWVGYFGLEIHCCMPMPDVERREIFRVERWLHQAFATENVSRLAKHLHLPAHTEWFLRLPALAELANGRKFYDLLDLQFAPDPDLDRYDDDVIFRPPPWKPTPPTYAWEAA